MRNGYGFDLIAVERLVDWGVPHSHHSSLFPPQATEMNRLCSSISNLFLFLSFPHTSLLLSTLHKARALTVRGVWKYQEQMNRTTGAALQTW